MYIFSCFYFFPEIPCVRGHDHEPDGVKGEDLVAYKGKKKEEHGALEEELLDS